MGHLCGCVDLCLHAMFCDVLWYLVVPTVLVQSQTKLTGVESQVNVIVASVFSERYRDVVEDVRVCCIKEMGTWIKEYK